VGAGRGWLSGGGWGEGLQRWAGGKSRQLPLRRHTASGGGGGGGGGARAERLNLDVERRPRTKEEMAAEAAELRALFYAPVK
jgi:hypothetical protein